MGKIRHIAIRTPDPEKTAAFYKEVFGLEEAGKAGTGVYLTDGYINLAVLRATDAGDRPGFAGLDHFGFQVEDADETVKKLEAHGSEALMSHTPPPSENGGQSYYEMKYVGPDNQVVDVSVTGWVGAE